MKDHPLIQRNNLFYMKKEYPTLINEIIYHHLQIDEKSLDILDKIKSDSDNVINALKPLSDLGIYFNIALAGGAIRDLVFKKQDFIKDLDYILSVDLGNVSVQLVNYFTQNKDIIFNMMDKMPISDNEKWNQPVFKISSLHPEEKLFEIIKILLSKDLNIAQSYTENTKVEELIFEPGQEPPYNDFNSQHKLTGVLHLEDKKLNYPVDILLTNSSVGDYVYHMDFDICKTSILLKQGKHDQIPTVDGYLNAFDCDAVFLDDYMNKTLTLNMKNKSIEQIEFSMSDHYYRIKEKYPDHELQLIPHTDEHKAFKLQWELSQSLGDNKKKSKTKKI
jgi:hypothetical protein